MRLSNALQSLLWTSKVSQKSNTSNKKTYWAAFVQLLWQPKIQRSATVSFGLGQAIRFTSLSPMANPRDVLSELSVLAVKVVVVLC
jgi:hypothetical protein